ncbi:MAG: class I SAM-dependent methyltransferase [Oscillospiraceae bacterium]
MLDSKGFNLWADGYDKSVNLSEEADVYPFAGYKNVLNLIYNQIRICKTAKILDIGFGTAVLSKRLYDENYEIYGIDFSEKMIDIAKLKMPNAHLIQYDFTNGLPRKLKDMKFDFIICTYAIHHLDDDNQIQFIKNLLENLTSDGKIFVGDVVFETQCQLDECRKEAQKDWDSDEFYPVVEKFTAKLENVNFEKISFCSGVITFAQ